TVATTRRFRPFPPVAHRLQCGRAMATPTGVRGEDKMSCFPPSGGMMDDAGTHYRLTGDVGGIVRSYGIPPGQSGLGSVPGDQIVLGVRGVSRRHARITLGA